MLRRQSFLAFLYFRLLHFIVFFILLFFSSHIYFCLNLFNQVSYFLFWYFICLEYMGMLSVKLVSDFLNIRIQNKPLKKDCVNLLLLFSILVFIIDANERRFHSYAQPLIRRMLPIYTIPASLVILNL